MSRTPSPCLRSVIATSSPLTCCSPARSSSCRTSYSFRMPLNERAVRMPLPVIEGNWGETQRRSSMFTWDEITWKS